MWFAEVAERALLRLSLWHVVYFLDVEFAIPRPVLELPVGIKATPKEVREQVPYCHATVTARRVRITKRSD